MKRGRVPVAPVPKSATARLGLDIWQWCGSHVWQQHRYAQLTIQQHYNKVFGCSIISRHIRHVTKIRRFVKRDVTATLTYAFASIYQTEILLIWSNPP